MPKPERVAETAAVTDIEVQAEPEVELDKLLMVEPSPLSIVPGSDKANSVPGEDLSCVVPPKLFYSPSELADLPKLEWLIEGILPTRSLVVVHGQQATFKSFLILDCGLSIASSRGWHDRTTKAGLVVYVAGEGHSGIHNRVAAWCKHHNVPIEDLDCQFILEALDFNDEDTARYLIDRVNTDLGRSPALIIIDTLARCNSGDENSSTDMSRLVGVIKSLQDRFGCSVVLIHHEPHSSQRARGSTVLGGAADTLISVALDGKNMTMKIRKQKDHGVSSDLTLTPLQIPLDADQSSVVLKLAVTSSTVETDRTGNSPQIDKRALARKEVVDFVAKAGPAGVQPAQITSALKISRTATYDRLKECVELGYLQIVGKSRWAVTPTAEDLQEPVSMPEDIDEVAA